MDWRKDDTDNQRKFKAQNMSSADFTLIIEDHGRVGTAPDSWRCANESHSRIASYLEAALIESGVNLRCRFRGLRITSRRPQRAETVDGGTAACCRNTFSSVTTCSASAAFSKIASCSGLVSLLLG